MFRIFPVPRGSSLSPGDLYALTGRFVRPDGAGGTVPGAISVLWNPTALRCAGMSAADRAELLRCADIQEPPFKAYWGLFAIF